MTEAKRCACCEHEHEHEHNHMHKHTHEHAHNHEHHHEHNHEHSREESSPCHGSCGITKKTASCACCGGDEDDGIDERILNTTHIIGGVGFVLAMLAEHIWNAPQTLTIALFATAYILLAWDVLRRAYINIKAGEIFDENLLMTVASIGAFAIGEYPEGVAVMLLYQLGEYLQSLAVQKSKRSIASLVALRPDKAHVVTDSGHVTREPESVAVGDIIAIYPGERVPLDGTITRGETELDTSAITGESKPFFVAVGGDVFAGAVVMQNEIYVRVTKPLAESAVSRIIELVQNAKERKSRAEKFITKFARVYTPIVVVCAVLLAFAPPLIIGANLGEWVRRALSFLIVSCPCALVISVPLAGFAGLGAASKQGIIIKGSTFLDALADVKTVVFDKTGTLTTGKMIATEVSNATLNEASNGGLSNEAIIYFAAHAEYKSSHPMAKSIVELYGKPIDKKALLSFSERAGFGVTAEVLAKDGKKSTVLAGSGRLMEANGVEYRRGERTQVHIAVDNRYVGSVILRDDIKDDAANAIADLRGLGVSNLTMLTGDRTQSAKVVADAVKLDAFKAELLPGDKLTELDGIIGAQRNENGKTMFVGDGVNDAPALTRADVGVAMGALSSDAAIEAADVAVLSGELSRLADAIRIARRVKVITAQNIVFSIGAKVVLLVLGALGITGLWFAVVGDVGVSLIAVLNATRAMRLRR